MFRKVISVLVIIIIPVLCAAQTTREKNALKDLAKSRWSKAFQTVHKSLRKDSTNVAAFYVLSQYYFHPENPAFSLDSAYHFAERARMQWDADSSGRQKARWSRLPLDSSRLVDLRESIEHKAFEEARRQDREESYVHYIEAYPFSADRVAAVARRNVVAYQKALDQNRYQAFQDFIDKYPDADQVPQAREKYEQLLFEYFTRDQRLESFELFLRDYPATPYRVQAERSIFQILTASGEPESFVDFLNRYPASPLSKTAADILFHILLENPLEAAIPPEHMSDSLRKVAAAEKDYLVPFLTKGRFGFMNSAGVEIVPPQEREIDGEYLCGRIAEDVIALHDRLLSDTGTTIWTGAPIVSVEDLGFGFLLLETDDGSELIHKSGLVPLNFSVQDAEVLSGSVIAVKIGGKWGLFTFTGRKLVDPAFESIAVVQRDALAFRRADSTQLSTIAYLVRNTGEVAFTESVHEVKRMGQLIWVRKDSAEALLNHELKPFVTAENHSLTATFFGAVSQTSSGFVTYNQFGERSEYFSQLIVSEPWVASKTADGWVLYNPDQRIYASVPYDTLTTYGPFAVGHRSDTIEIHLFKKPNHSIILPAPDRIELIPGQDSVSFILVEKDKKVNVYDATGRDLFQGTYEKIQYAGEGLFVVSRKEKKGLVDSTGKPVLPIEFHAIGTAANGTVSLLKAMKFGLYDIEKKKLIKPNSDKNVTRFNSSLYTSFRNGFLGFVDADSKPASEFIYSEILPWNDSLALVTQDGVYHLYDVVSRQNVISGIRKFRPVRDTPAEREYILFLKDQVGVVNSRKGVVIPLNFSDVVNLGSVDKPLYFTEKHVKEALLFVVIYYDNTGNMIRREVYEPEEYERIYCRD